MSTAFQDIAIVDLDLPKTTWSRVHSAMRTLHLKLSREPEVGWTRFFHEERESRIVIKRHGLWIEENFIVFDCLLEDVEQHHLPDFRLSVAYANQKYHEFLATRRDEGEQVRDEARQENEELMALRKLVREKGVTASARDAKRALQPKPVKPIALRPADNDSNTHIADLDAKREEWRARFRAALASRPKEPARGND